ncbi:kinase-like domain-containing protein [Rhizophagus irregularis DAOM 181602=DAOM 197198]|nr:kinase-like domain-containing protein [Rhizophagus irregularis DAOM 181602=DAOM 197198]
MEYANKGNLRGCLTEITKNWGQKLYMLYKIIIGLKDIHEKGLIHYNFHDGNILCNKYSENVYEIYISDYLRSYQLAKPFSKENKSQGLKDDDDIEQELLKLGMIAETSSQNELKEVYQNIQIKLVDLQQKNFQFEQDNQILRLNLAVQIKEFAEKENTLQTQITLLQKQALLASDLTENLEQNKLINQQIQIQIDHLEQEKIGLQEKIIQTEANNQELKFQQESLIEQKEQLENKISQPQDNYKAIEQGKIKLHNMGRGLSQDHKLKAKLEKEIAQLEQKLIIEDQIKMQLTQVLQIKEDKVNELEQRLVVLDYERIERLKDKEKELSKVIEELVNKLTSGENTKEIHKEKESKQREMVELQQELSKTSAFYYSNKKKQVLNQANNFLKAKDNFLASREEAIKKLQNCCNNLERFTNKERNTIGSISDMKIFKLADKYTKEFQNTLVKYSDGLLQLNKVYDSLVDIVQKNKELEVSLVVENMLKLNSFNLDKYNIFKFVTNSQEGARTQLNSNMMMEDIDSLRKNLNELKSELKQEKKELKNLAEIRINYIDGSL